MSRTRALTSSRRNKTLAVLAGGTLVGVAVTATLAAWTDTEWIFGGNGAGGPGIGTSTFEVEQNTVAPFAAAGFVNEETNPGGEVTFGLDALDLTPGDAVYAQVALRSATDSVAGSVELQPAVAAAGVTAADPTGLLAGALDVAVATDDAPFACDASAFLPAAVDVTVIADGPLLSTGAAASQDLEAEAGSVQYYCFEVSLPDAPVLPGASTLDDLMGRSFAPAWEFAAATA
jgi:predicted ribosomally synthesized peptide with SipW-like signal peptide